MQEFLETVKQHIRDHPPDYGDGEFILNLPPLDFDQVFYTVSDPCLEHCRLAFGGGFKVDMLLMQELTHK